MKAPILIFLSLLCACDSGSGTAPDGAGGGGDAPPSSAGFALTLDGPYTSSAAVTIHPVKTNGVFAGYFEAQSDLSMEPNLDVTIHVPSASLSVGSYPCARSATADSFNATSVLVHWLDGHTYATNLFPAPTCTVKVTAASQTSVTATISGTIFDQTDADHPGSAFTASFTAQTVN